MMNNITVMGRITKEMELRRTESGKEVCSFSIACDRDFNKGEVDFFDCVTWGNTAVFVQKYFNKGSLIALNGRLQNRSWQDKEGNTRRITEIAVSNAYFCGGKKEEKEEKQDFVVIENDESLLPF